MIANVDLGGDSQARGRISGELAHGTPECEKLRRCDEVLLAVVNSQWQASLAQHRCWRKSDLSEPYPKGVRGFETVWHVDGHFFSRRHFVWKQSLSRHSSGQPMIALGSRYSCSPKIPPPRRIPIFLTPRREQTDRDLMC